MKVPFPVTIEYVEMKPMEKDEMLRNAGTRSGGYSTCVQKCLLSGANIMFSYDFSFNVWLALIMSLDAPCETFDSPSSNHEPDASIGPGWANIAPRWAHIAPQGSPRVTKGHQGSDRSDRSWTCKKTHHFSSKIYHHYHPQISPSDFHIFFRASPQQLQLPLPVPGCHVWAAGPMRCLWKLDVLMISDVFPPKKMWMFWWFLTCFPEKMDVGRCWMSGYIWFFICWNVWVILTASCRTWWRSVSEPWPCQSLFQPQKPWRQTMQMPKFVGCWCYIYIFVSVHDCMWVCVALFNVIVGFCTWICFLCRFHQFRLVNCGVAPVRHQDTMAPVTRRPCA